MISPTNPTLSPISVAAIIGIVTSCIGLIAANSYDSLDTILSNISSIYYTVNNVDFQYFDGVTSNSLINLVTHLSDLQIRIEGVIEQLNNGNPYIVRDLDKKLAVLNETNRQVSDLITRLEDLASTLKDE